MADLLPSLPILLTFAIAVAVLAVTPGPDMTLFLSKTVGQSRAAGVAAYAGAATGLLVHTLLVAVGLSALLVASATAFTVLKVAGAAYLVWLAVDAVRNGSSLRMEEGRRREGLGSVYLKGLFVNLLNPKIIVFFITFLPQFVSPQDPDAPGQLIVLGVLFVVVASPICLAMIAFAGAIAAFLKRSPRVTRVVDWLFAGILGSFALKLMTAEASPGR